MDNRFEFQFAEKRSSGLTWFRLTRIVEELDDKEKKTVIYETSGPHHVILTATKALNGITQLQWEIEPSTAIEWVSCQYDVEMNEQFYGFGERFDSLKHRGKELRLWVENGCVHDLTYKPIPFFISTAGYGVHLDHQELIYARMATPDLGSKVKLSVYSSKLSLYWMEDDAPSGIIEKYTTIVGKPTLPPPWFFGVWKSRDWRVENQQTVLIDLEKQREFRIPCTVKLIDAAWEQELNDFRFHACKFPEKEQFLEKATQLDYQLVLWISPWVAIWSDIYQELDQKGFFLRHPNGETYVHRLANNPGLIGSMIDFTNPKATEWWQTQCEVLMELGVRGIKTDFGEQVPEDSLFFDGTTGKTMHNYYPVLYNKVTHEVVNRYRGILLGRSAWSGSQAFTGVWAGDQTADFAPRSGMLSTVFAGQSIGISGFPYWGSDIGGYFGKPGKECFIRWTQYAAFTPCMELHGLEERDPWDMDEEALGIYIAYASLHTRLFPYLYPLAIEASGKGVPMIRALMLHYSKDSSVHDLECVETQFLLGDKIIVAPLFYEGREREVYLPSDGWVDAWTGELTMGPWNGKVKAPLEQIPFWIKAGTILPLLPEEVQSLASYDSPEHWVNVLGNQRWDFLVIPGQGETDQGGLRIEQRLDDDAGLVVTIRALEGRPIPSIVRLKLRLSPKSKDAISLLLNGFERVGTWTDASWESGMWVDIPIDQGSSVYIHVKEKSIP